TRSCGAASSRATKARPGCCRRSITCGAAGRRRTEPDGITPVVHAAPKGREGPDCSGPEYARPAMSRQRSAKPCEGACSTPQEPGSVARRPLFQGLGVRVDDFRCRAHARSRSAEEPNPTHSIVFVRRGLFTRTDRDGTIVGDANQILFFN